MSGIDAEITGWLITREFFSYSGFIGIKYAY